ncbi:MAG: hypothetical protein WA880_13320, partial [Ornithinimicrobium sp.]
MTDAPDATPRQPDLNGPAASDPDFDVVLLGTDIGIYALARAFHERYGISSTVISRVVAGPIA